MKVMIVKEVMTGDVSPVAMFLKWLGIIDHLDLEPFSFHFSFSKRVNQIFISLFTSRNECNRFSFHLSLLELPISTLAGHCQHNSPPTCEEKKQVRYSISKTLFVLPVKLSSQLFCLVAFLASASLFLSSSDGQALTKYNYKCSSEKGKYWRKTHRVIQNFWTRNDKTETVCWINLSWA